ncbi:MAG TPA: hypothetical protein VKP58_14500 [Candidatus Acidoferrum sp.]|nr:hypothetical protein [Candidatus Acidoferrum sp.]
MKIRPLISKVLGPPAVLFLAYVGCSVAYQLIWGSIDGSRRKRQAAVIVEDFHSRLASGNFTDVCDDSHSILVSNYGDCSVVLRNVRSQFGKFRRLKTIHLQAIGEPRWVEAKCVAEFERGELPEEFMLAGDSRGGLKVFGYWPQMETTQRLEK